MNCFEIIIELKYKAYYCSLRYNPLCNSEL